MKRAGPDFCWIGLGILISLLVLAASGAVMREGDQAALLEGSVAIARSWELVDQPWYNYDKQFLSYWFLAAVFDVTAHDATWVDPSKVVELGNLAAAVFFVASLLTAFVLSPRQNLSFMPIALAAFLAPSLIFSLPLLASNIFSAASLLLLAAAMRKRHAGWANALLCALLTAVAVGFRTDAALVLPALCLLSTTKYSIGGILRELRHWLMLLAAVGTFFLGQWLGVESAYRPDLFFDLRLFGAYLGFGLAGTLVVLLWLPMRLVTSRRRWFLRAATGLSILVPLLAYAPLLYTPRHLILSALMLLLMLVLPRGARWWSVLLRGRVHRFAVWAAVVGSTAFWLVGLRFESMSQARIVREDPTLYPTADGFWPMGCFRNFLIDLAHGGEVAIDHNQEVWEAWTRVPVESLPAGEPRVHSAGLRSLGELFLRIKGIEYAVGSDGDYDLVADRSLGRARAGFYQTYGAARDEIDWRTCWLEEVSSVGERQIYRVERESSRPRTLELRWVAQLAIVEAVGPDDFHLRHASRVSNWFGEESEGHRISVVFAQRDDAEQFLEAAANAARDPALELAPETGANAAVVTFVRDGPLPIEAQEIAAFDGLWISRSVLPAFMSRKNYNAKTGG